MSDKPAPSDTPNIERAKNSEQLRESVPPSRHEKSTDRFTPSLTVNERDPVPTEPPKRK